jgi:hypothetical protein
MSRFFEVFTAIQEQKVKLILHQGDLIDRDFTYRAYRQAARSFGRAEQKPIPVHPNPGNEHTFTWLVGVDQIADCLALMNEIEPFPEHRLGGPLLLRIPTVVHVRDPESGDIFPFQGPDYYGGHSTGWDPLGISYITPNLGRRCTCGLFLSFPFTELTPSVRDYIRRFDAALPFPLSKKTWSRWQLNKAGTGYNKRRVFPLD